MAEYIIIEITAENVTNMATFQTQEEAEIGSKLFSLGTDTKVSIRKLGTEDWKIIGLFNKFLENHPESLPANFPIANIQLAILNMRRINEIKSPIESMITKIESTKLVYGSVIKKGMDDAYAHLKKEVSDDEDYREIFEALKKIYARAGRNVPEIRSIDANSSVVFEGFISNTRLSNVGDAVIEITIGASEGKNPKILVPGESWMIPKDTKTLFLKNKLATDEAHYSVRMKTV